MRKIELLCPASSLEVLKIAVIYGADAVYIGGEAFGLRAKAKNFSMEEMAEGVAFAHAHGVRVYVTANILAHNYDLDGVREYFTELHNMKPDRPDALIIADPGIYMYAKEICPEIERHISTQANNTNYETYRFWYNLGAKRVVTARELSLKEIKEIRGHIDDRMEIETFVHGAMCMAYSGRCLLSSWLSGRGGNKGECVQACRWEWQVSLTEREHPDKPLFLNEDERGVYIMNSRDLCLMPYLNRALETGAVSLKIEGRMKSAHYVGTVVNAYRRALDACLAGSFSKSVSDGLLNELKKTSHRAFTSGFLFGKDFDETENFFTSKAVADGNFVASVLDWSDGVAAVEMRNRFFEGDTLEILSANDSFGKTFAVADMRDENGTPVVDAKLVRQILKLPCPYPLEKFDILRKA